MVDVNIDDQFERAWENAMAVSGLNKEWISVLGESAAKDMAQHWWLKGHSSAKGTMWWPDPATYLKDSQR